MNLNDVISKDTPHFKWKEVFDSNTARSRGIDNTVISQSYLQNVINTAVMMEKVRDLFNSDPKVPHTIRVSSWYRCEALNTAVGGTKTSHHRLGMAVDFHVINKVTGVELPIKEVVKKIMDSKLPFTQLIDEYKRWTHISFQSDNYKRQVLTFRYDAQGKTVKYPGML